MDFFEKAIRFFQDWIKKLTNEDKQRFIIVCTVIFAVLLILSVIISTRNSGRENIPLEPERINLNIPIPAEELFLPDEPDFLPGVVLERDRRLVWTEQDAMEYWLDPLMFGEEQWRQKIETAIDEFLEHIQ